MTYENYIDGEWRASTSGETVASHNPAQTDEVVGELQASTVEDAEDAIAAAAETQADWEATPGPDRGAILRETGKVLEDRKDELTETLTTEEGKTWSEAAGEVQRAIDIFYYYASKASDLGGEVKQSSSETTHLYIRQEAVGVVSAITPWNYPIAIPAWKIAPALAAATASSSSPRPTPALSASNSSKRSTRPASLTAFSTPSPAPEARSVTR